MKFEGFVRFLHIILTMKASDSTNSLTGLTEEVITVPPSPMDTIPTFADLETLHAKRRRKISRRMVWIIVGVVAALFFISLAIIGFA